MNTILEQELNSLKVVESNELIRASYKLNKRSLIFIFYLIAKLDSIKQEDFTDIFLTFKQVGAILNFDGKRRINKRSEVFAMMDDLNTAPIFREDTNYAVQVNWLSSVFYDKTNDTFRLRIDSALKPYLLQLKSHFGSFFYKYVVPMKLPSSIRLYTILKSYHAGNGMIEKIFEVEDLKFRLGLKGRYKKFYDLKRRVLVPAMKDMQAFTDLKADFIVYETVKRIVTKIKFQIIPNKAILTTLVTPEKFIEKTEAVDLADPVFGNEIYQMLNLLGIHLNPKVRAIVEQCDADESYKQYVKDTVNRCKKDLERNPKISNKPGFVLKAIATDYYKSQREDEENQKKQDALTKAHQAQEKHITSLLERGKQAFHQRREPHVQGLRTQYLTDTVVQSAIKEHAPTDAIRRKVTNTYTSGKPSKLLDSRIDDYLARKYLDYEFSNLDSFLAKNYGLQKRGEKYILSTESTPRSE